MTDTQELAERVKRLRELQSAVEIAQTPMQKQLASVPYHREINTMMQTINDLVNLVGEMHNALESIKPIAVVQGDAAQHTNPHTRIMLNSSCAWLVTDADKSAHKNRTKKQNVEAALTKSAPIAALAKEKAA